MGDGPMRGRRRRGIAGPGKEIPGAGTQAGTESFDFDLSGERAKGMASKISSLPAIKNFLFEDYLIVTLYVLVTTSGDVGAL
jgi:hypothetical protein